MPVIDFQKRLLVTSTAFYGPEVESEECAVGTLPLIELNVQFLNFRINEKEPRNVESVKIIP